MDWTPLMVAADKNHAEFVRAIVSAAPDWVDVNGVNDNGETALTIAVK